MNGAPARRWIGAASAAALGIALAACVPAAEVPTPQPDAEPLPAAAIDDPRVGLEPGLTDAGEAIHNLRHIAHRSRPEGFYNPADPGDGAFSNTDLAFQGDHVFVGNYNGFNIYDISDPANPRLRTSVVCPGGQGDPSVVGDLLFLSAQEPRGRIDCGTQGAPGAVNPERFRGVRIFDISDLDRPRQIAAVQTCRGSHTHTVVTEEPGRIILYNSGTSFVRPAEEMAGCSDLPPEQDPNTSLYQIEVIEVPLDAPQNARIVNEPRIFQDYETGEIAGLWPGGGHGEGTQRTRETSMCHDITVYPAIGLAAGACSGNGLLLDISDPVNPVRIDAVIDPHFAYWHSATFNNDGTSVVFTDEWGGGVAPRCRAEDAYEWGANAIFHLSGGEMEFAGYYKMPAPQTELENCVAHNGSLIPVPGRDIKVQAWYQGGISVMDFTDPENPYEIAFFDRGPISATELITGGYWSAYWYNGQIYGSEIVRGLDVLELVPSEHLSANEIAAAELVRFEEFNPQHQPRITWPPSVVVSRAYLDQLVRNGGIEPDLADRVAAALDRIERAEDGADHAALAAALEEAAGAVNPGGARGDADRLRLLADSMREMAVIARR